MKKMIHRVTFAALSAAVVLGGAAAPAAANMILGGYAGPPVADQTARRAKAALPTSRHARHVKAAVATSDARNANASVPASQDARTTKASAGQENMDPRAAYLLKRKGSTSHETSCDVDPQCNGWAQWQSDVESGRRPMVGAHAQ